MEGRPLRATGYLDVLIRGQTSLADGKVPLDQASVVEEEGTEPEQNDPLTAENIESNSNLGPRDMSEKALSPGIIGYLAYTVIGLAFNSSPAALRGVENLSRGTRGKLSQVVPAGKGLLKRLSMPKESQNVLPAANPSATIRVSMSATANQAFSLSLLAVEEKYSRESWSRASAAIGSGLSRPELYLASHENPAVHISLRTYADKRDFLQDCPLERLMSPESAFTGCRSKGPCLECSMR